MKWVPFQSPSLRKPMREFCELKWNSLRLPLAVLLNGMLPKFEPMLDPAFLSRQYGVRSMNPMGTMQTLPIRRKVGMDLSGSASHGFLEEPVALGAEACGKGIAGRAMATGSDLGRGTKPALLATSPRLRKVLTGAG